VGQALAAAAAQRADAVGATGGGQLAWVVAAGSAHTNCATVCPGGGHCFLDVTGGAFWEEVALHWGDDNRRMTPAFWADFLRLTQGGTLSIGSRLGQFNDITRTGVPSQKALMVYTSFAEYTENTAWLVMRPPNMAFDYLEVFAFANNGDPINGVREQRRVLATVAEIAMISISLHRHLLRLVGACVAFGKPFIVFGFYASFGDHHDKAAIVLLDKHLASEHISSRPLSEKSIVFGFGILLLVLVSGHRARQGLCHSAQSGGCHVGAFGGGEDKRCRLDMASWT
jgi:hypothetical protein